MQALARLYCAHLLSCAWFLNNFSGHRGPINSLFTFNSLEEQQDVEEKGGAKNNLKVIGTLEAHSSVILRKF